MKKILAVLLVLCTLFLSGCGMFKDVIGGMGEATDLVEEFCIALSEDDFDTAKDCLHPDFTPSHDNLSDYILQLEQKLNINFSNGVKFKRRTGIESTYYDSEYGGSVHKIEYKIVVGSVDTQFFFVVVKNNNGYGLYSFKIEK